jgi:hypothetical protein
MFLLVELLALPNCKHPIKLFTYSSTFQSTLSLSHYSEPLIVLFPIICINNCKFVQVKLAFDNEISWM